MEITLKSILLTKQNRPSIVPLVNVLVASYQRLNEQGKILGDTDPLAKQAFTILTGSPSTSSFVKEQVNKTDGQTFRAQLGCLGAALNFISDTKFSLNPNSLIVEYKPTPKKIALSLRENDTLITVENDISGSQALGVLIHGLESFGGEMIRTQTERIINFCRAKGGPKDGSRSSRIETLDDGFPAAKWLSKGRANTQYTIETVYYKGKWWDTQNLQKVGKNKGWLGI